ncbi:MAG: HesA/MoeB/ThiF family protein [Aquabacterium sp.]|nr:MAG: HesA/MoeB/ThiF family protein [Aquabacterium sp.]
MDDDQLLRYSRHVLLDEWGVEAQRRVAAAHAVVIGAGGLGSPALLYLASAGVGRITVVDHDSVDLTNLQRQVAHSTERIGRPKAESAAQAMAALNPGIRIDALPSRADEALLQRLVPEADVVLDCTDGFDARQAINRACVRAGKPLVWAAAVRFDAQLSVYDPHAPGCPCYACLFPPDTRPQEVACATMGVFAPLVGMTGVMQAGEALKLLAQVGRPLASRLLMLDGRTLRFDELRVAARADCPVCAAG